MDCLRNKAMSGGAVYLRPSSQVKNVVSAAMINCTGNRAVKRLDEIYSEPLNYADIDVIRTQAYGRSETSKIAQRAAGVAGRNLLEDYFQDKSDGSEVLLKTTGEDPCSPGGGGAVCLVLSEVPERASVKVEILNSFISDNYAATGGPAFPVSKRSVSQVVFSFPQGKGPSGERAVN